MAQNLMNTEGFDRELPFTGRFKLWNTHSGYGRIETPASYQLVFTRIETYALNVENPALPAWFEISGRG